MIGLATLVSLVSLSRAGGIACFLLLGLAMLQSTRKASNLLLMILCVIGVVFYGVESSWYERNMARAARVEATFGSEVEGRGWTRIADDPQYLIFGAGEGEYGRFGGLLANLHAELHSTIGSAAFSYGIPGLLLFFLMYFGVVARGRGGYEVAALMAPLLYGFVHNGLRFTTIWIMFGMFLVSSATRMETTRRFAAPLVSHMRQRREAGAISGGPDSAPRPVSF
jgi:hypothetical protein